MFRNAHHYVMSKFYRSRCVDPDVCVCVGGGGGGGGRGSAAPWKITNGSDILRNTSCSTDTPREAIGNFGELCPIAS